jgi:hypothetical protein
MFGSTAVADATYFIDTPPGDLFIDWAVAESFTLETSNQEEVTSILFDNYIEMIVEEWYSDAAYSTLEISNRTGTHAPTLPASIAQIQATSLDLLTWSADAQISLHPDTAMYQSFASPIVWFERSIGAATADATYGTKPRIQFTIPSYTTADTYQATITHTLYK